MMLKRIGWIILIFTSYVMFSVGFVIYAMQADHPWWQMLTVLLTAIVARVYWFAVENSMP